MKYLLSVKRWNIYWEFYTLLFAVSISLRSWIHITAFIKFPRFHYDHFVFQQAAGIFGHLKDTSLSVCSQDPTPDLAPDTLNALSALMVAQAQEAVYRKAVMSKSSVLYVYWLWIGICMD